MNRNLSSFDIYVISGELKELVGSYIDKIYQISQNEILIRFRNVKTSEKEVLYIRNGDFICITSKSFDTPQKPSNFAMTMRKYLQNGTISSVSQHEFDRILKIKIGKKEGDYTVVIEFFSDGNIILVNPKGNIIYPFIRQSWAHRTLKGRQPYSPPPSQINPFKLDFDEFSKLLETSDEDIVRTLAVKVNLSGVIAEEICKKAKIDKNKKINDLKKEEIEKIFNALEKFLKIFKNKDFEPVFVKKDREIFDILPFKFESYKDYSFEKTDSLVRGLEKFIKQKNKKEEKKESKIDKKIGKLKRQRTQQENKVDELKHTIKKRKIEGELIYLHYQKIDTLLKGIENVLDLKDKTEGIEKVKDVDFVKEFDPENKKLILSLKDTKGNFFDVKIDYSKSVSDNAEKAYDNSKKMKSKLHGANKALEKTKDKLNQAEKLKEKDLKIKKIQEEKPVKKKKTFWFEKLRWFISSNGNVVVGGRDAKTNDLVVKKYLKERDRYAHADISGAPSIVIKSKDVNGKFLEINEQTLNEACIFAASFSKAWKQFAEAQAYWVLPEQVSKTPQSGEFVPRGAFIIRGKRNYQKCKLEVAVGLIEIDGYTKFMGGPFSAVNSHCDKYVILQPGNIKKSDISKQIASAFDVDVEEVSRVLPPGGAVITDSKGVDI